MCLPLSEAGQSLCCLFVSILIVTKHHTCYLALVLYDVSLKIIACLTCQMSRLADSEAMTSRQYVHLPTEVLILIAKFIFDDWPTEYPRSQVTLQRFCLVSRQWYSVGIEFLYYRPQLGGGNSFSLFTNTVCPPIRSRKRNVDLGSLVHDLDLSVLVHHSSNSLTARLLGRVKKNLKSFAAPRISFS